MAVSEQTPYIEYTANGIATSFALGFDCDNRDHLIVLVDDVEPVVGAWSFSNGAVVFNTAPENGKKITLQRNTPFSRTTDYQSYNNSFRPPAVNNDFDKVWYKIQELGVKDWLLDLKIQKFRDDVNLTALENTLEEAKQIRDDTAGSVVEVQSNVAQSQTLLENTTAQANLAQGYANSANSANTAAQQAVIDVSTAEADVYSALSAQQIAVNNSLTAIAGGHKAYQTLAAAQAAQASLPANTVVEVTNDPTSSNNGTYQWNGTTLTKSAYDPLTQAKSFTKDAIDVFDASKVSGNYALTFDQAVALIPSDLKKRFLTLKYNNSEALTYINTNLTTNWTNQRFWIRQINTMAEGKINHFDERMIYKGFTIGGNDALNACAIIPIHRTYTNGVENKITIRAYPKALSPVTWGFLKSDGTSLGALTGISELSGYTIPVDAAYVYINLETNNGTSVVGAGNVEIAKKGLRYFPDNTAPTVSNPSYQDGFDAINYGVKAPIYEDRTPQGTEFVSPFFKGGLATYRGVHIAQIVKHVEIQKGQQDLVVASTGLPRRFIITQISKFADGKTVSVQISGENESGVLQANLPANGTIDAYGFANIEWVRMQADVLRVKLLVDANQIPNGATIPFGDNGEIHPSVVMNADKVKDVNKGVQFTQFTDVGVARTSSNMASPDAEAVTLTKRMTNGFLFNKIVGDASKEHQQTTLIASKLARFNGKASIYADVKATYPNNPVVTLLRETGGAPYNGGSSAGYGVLGKTMDSQWIHPDMCYAPEGVGGYKYWMVNSNFPNGNDRQEDANLFVSNDGVNWTRVRGFNETDDGGVGFKTPQIHWTSNYANGFMSIPRNGNSFEFALASTIETKTIVGHLNHDPAISYHNGYVNVYILYNVGFSADQNAMTDKYTVCYRTNNGIDWEIVREDGSTMPYNADNAQLIFTKTNGVRNHVRHISKTVGVGGWELSPQIVKVSDTEWYYYARDYSNVTPTSGQSMNLIRYRGTSPYTFNFNDRQIISKNNANGGLLWHFGVRYYDGVFYCMTNGFVFTSTDGINFTTTPYPFFWRGMSSDIYKPTFVVGHDGKVKMAYGIQSHLAVPHSYNPQNPVSLVDLNRVQANLKITSTLITQYTSLADIMNRSNSPVEDAYVDIIVMSISQRTKSTQVRLLPCLRSYSELLNTIDISFDDEVYVVAHMNTRNGGSVEFSGVAVTLPNAALN